jgi:UDP-N-acetyl-2-amino-2-deoxyglucuronate dehydrogenase
VKQLKFLVLGAGGYIADRHLRAIQEVGGVLVAAHDRHDVVGRLDMFTRDVEFFTDFERLDDFVRNLHPGLVDVVSVCTPNDFHLPHVLWGLSAGCDVICEKPLSLKAEDVLRMQEMERKTGKRVNVILQLRVHPRLQEAKRVFETGYHEVSLDYSTPRGPWYAKSWKANESRSGGVLTNIGIHFFDAMCWLLGKPLAGVVSGRTPAEEFGELWLERGHVKWNLSIADGVPQRRLVADGDEIDFTAGFTTLHTVCYQQVLAGTSPGTEDALPSVELAQSLRGQLVGREISF